MKKYLLIAMMAFVSLNLVAQDGPKTDKKEMKSNKKTNKIDKKTYRGQDHKAVKKN